MFYLTDPFIKMIKGMSWESLLSQRYHRQKRSETELIEAKVFMKPQELPKKKNKC
jgi:hypothetical protein